MAEDRQVALPHIDTLPLNNPHLLRAMYTQFETIMSKTDSDIFEGADAFKAMGREESSTFFSNLLQHTIQSKSVLQFCLVHQRLFQRLEIAVKQNLFSKGIATIALSQLEAKKYNLLADLIQAGNDKDALEYIRYYSELLHDIFDIPITESDEEIQEEIKQQFIRHAASMSEKHFNSAAVKIIKDTEQYYFEESSVVAQASGFEVISYDPLFSLPQGKL